MHLLIIKLILPAHPSEDTKAIFAQVSFQRPLDPGLSHFLADAGSNERHQLIANGSFLFRSERNTARRTFQALMRCLTLQKRESFSPGPCCCALKSSTTRFAVSGCKPKRGRDWTKWPCIFTSSSCKGQSSKATQVLGLKRVTSHSRLYHLIHLNTQEPHIII